MIFKMKIDCRSWCPLVLHGVGEESRGLHRFPPLSTALKGLLINYILTASSALSRSFTLLLLLLRPTGPQPQLIHYWRALVWTVEVMEVVKIIVIVITVITAKDAV